MVMNRSGLADSSEGKNRTADSRRGQGLTGPWSSSGSETGAAAMRHKLAATSAHMQVSDGTRRAARLLDALIKEHG